MDQSAYGFELNNYNGTPGFGQEIEDFKDLRKI